MGQKILKIPLQWISSCRRYHVNITDACLRKMISASRSALPRETGASVYGSYSVDGFIATVLGNSPVTSDSASALFSFFRGVKGVNTFFSEMFRRTNGKRHYVGEWHSHPGGVVTPSSEDNRTLQAIAADRTTGCPECILLIVGGDITNAPSLGVYVYSRDKRRRIDLHAVDGGKE